MNYSLIHWQPMIRTEFAPKVVVNPYGFALFPWVALKRLKNSHGLYISSCGLVVVCSFSVQQVPSFRTAPGFDFYIFVSLWLVCESCDRCDNEVQQLPQTLLESFDYAMTFPDFCEHACCAHSRYSNKKRWCGGCYYTFWVFQKNTTKVRWLSLIFFRVSFDV